MPILHDQARSGEGLRRPESVLCTSNGDVFTSHADGVVMHIDASGRQKPIGRRPAGVDFVPNGICLLRDGSLLVANIGTDGGIWKLGRDGDVTPFLLSADGIDLSAANFVGLDEAGRFWISVSTRTVPRNDVYNRRLADGFLVLLDDRGARIVADGLAFTNESRLSADGRYLFVAETAGRRITRFDVTEQGELRGRDVFTEFGRGDFPDGIEFDRQGHLWVACVVSNRLIRVAPDGCQEVLVQDTTDAYVDDVEAALASGTIAKAHFYEDAGRTIRALTSVAFGGPALDRVYLGSLVADTLTTFRSSMSGRPPVHWTFSRPF